MKDCLVDVLNARGTVLHVFPIAVENQDGTPKDVDPEQEALKLAAVGQLVPETESETLQAREHVSRGGPLMPYSDALETKVQKGSVKNLGRYAARWIACWPKRPSSTAALTWRTRWAPRGDQRICWRLFMRALTSWLTVPSAREVEIGLPAR